MGTETVSQCSFELWVLKRHTGAAVEIEKNRQSAEDNGRKIFL